ncbi:putative Sodium:inorganic phosphate symporter [Sesbania bispinosa]|nr:putative Sodium:inorganic phosphate symporter [Sesbania bispinosa]
MTEDPPPLAGQDSATVDGNTAPQSQGAPTQETTSGPVQVVAPAQDPNNDTGTAPGKGEGSQLKRQRKSANPRQHIPKSLQKESLQKKCLKKGPATVPQSQVEIQNNLLVGLFTKLTTSITDLTRVTSSPSANHIQSAKRCAENHDIPISPELLHTYNTMQQLADLAKTMATGEGGNSNEAGGTKPT